MPEDIQSLPIADAELHWQIDGVGRTFLDIQQVRVGINNRFKAAERDGALAPGIDVALEGMEAIEKQLDKELTRLLRQHFMKDWIQNECKGVGLPLIGRLLGVIGPLDRYATVSKLWKYCGLAVYEDGTTQKKKAGEKINYSPMARVVCHRIGDGFKRVGQGGKYRTLYEQKKAEYLERPRFGESNCPMGRIHKSDGKIVQCVKEDEEGKITSGHLDTAAMRYAVKCFLRDFWEEWHRRRAKTGVLPGKGMPDSGHPEAA